MGMPPLVSGRKPVIGHLAEFLRTPEKVLWRGYREHGLAYSLAMPGQDAVVLLGSEHSKFVFTETDKSLSIGEAYPFFERMFSPDFYYFGGVDEYHRQRNVVLPRFQGRQLDDYVTTMDEEATRFVAALGESGQFDLTEELGPLVMRIAARCFLGEDFADHLGRDFFDEFRQFSDGMGFYPGWLPLPKTIRSNRSRDRLKKAVTAVIHARRAQPLDPPDFLQTMAQSQYADGTPVPDEVLVNLILLLSWAGHETTTGHLAWSVIDLLQHPDERDRARAEAQRLFDAGPVDVASSRQLAHINNCILESERLHPVAHILARKAAQDIELDGHSIPKGAYVFVAPSVTHRITEGYPQPDEFWPDRFDDGPEGKQARQTLIGFGAGIHRCLGVHFAQLEMKLILARLLTNFDMELVGAEPQPVSGSRTKWPAGPCLVRYKRRAPVAMGTG